MTVYPLQANMTRGEITPLAHARGDTEHYGAGLALGRNVCVLRYGGVTRTPGTLFMGAARYANKLSRFIPFKFKRTQVYAIEAGDLYFRFWTTDGPVETSPGVPYTLVTTYAEADLKYMRVRQSGDVIYIWCAKAAGGAYPVRKLTRVAETNWTIADHAFKGGPFLKEETNGATMTPASYGSITPTMTGLTAPSGTVSSSGGGAGVWNLFDKDVDTYSQVDATGSGYIQYRQAGSAQVIADAYYVTAPKNALSNGDMPSIWQLQGSNNGATWVTLDSRRGETGWGNSETRYYDFDNSVAYEYYRFNFQGGGGADATSTEIAEIGIHRKDSNQTPFNLTLSSAAAINDGAGFLATDVGRVIRLLGSDGRYRVFTIATRTSSTVVTGVLDGHALPDLSPISRWQMGAFSPFSGFPRTGAIYEDRLVHASTDEDPLGMWFSVSADYDNYAVSTPLVADDGVSVRLTGGDLDEISWLDERVGKDIVAGTASTMRAVGRNNEGEAFGPSNVRQKAQTIAPSSIAEPVSIENVLLFLDLFEQRLYEAAYTYEVDGYLAREASTLNEHLFAAGVAELCYLSQPHKIIVGRRYDGKLIFFTYDREQKVAGATLVDFGGVVESVMNLQGDTATDLWMVIQRTVDGGTVRYVEKMAEFWREDYTVQGVPLYAACGGIYDGATTTTISDLDHLEGETLGVWADGRDIGDAEVVAGVLTLPSSVSAEQVAWGLRMPWQVRTLRLTQIGNQDGSGLGRSVNIVSAFIDLLEAASVNVGSLHTQDLMTFEDEIEEDPDAPKPLRTGMYEVAVDDSWQNNGVLDINGNSMYPATIRAIQLNVDGEP